MAEFTFDRTVDAPGSAESIWELITDVQRLVSWISVIHNAIEIEPLARYSAVIQDKVGMFKLNADLSVRFTEVHHDERIIARAVGKDRQLGTRITIDGEVSLAPGPTSTSVRVSGSYAITGNAATLGSSAIKRKGDKVLEEFFANLEADLSALAGS
jgi:carbon monoxide dehydrogenase subunit G